MTKRKADYIIRIHNQAQQVARVIYAQVGPKATVEQIKAVASVIYNRVGKREFGNLKTLQQVAYAKNAFSCTSGTDGNQNWKNFSPTLNRITRLCMSYSFIFCAYQHQVQDPNVPLKVNMNNDLTEEIVYFLTKGTKVPSCWEKYFKVSKKTLKNVSKLDFYSISKK